MLFNSLHFAVFLPCVVIIYFATPGRWRWTWLLAASYYFYACWKIEYLALIVVSTLVDYVVARCMARAVAGRRTFLLCLSLAVNLGLLFAFKYFNFVNASVRAVFGHFDLTYSVPALDVLLPVGISFYTFQTLSDTIDVYRGKRQPEMHLGIFALYVAYFPQLVAGPIERSTRLLPQLRVVQNFDFDRLKTGLVLMLWGFFQKLVIADRMAMVVDHVYTDPQQTGGAVLLIGTYAFAFQIYCDFAGYSNIAIGTAKIMGIDLMQNFRQPYYARSIPEFWRRWHISLSTWFRDYVYIPLGGSRVRKLRLHINLLLVFAVSAIWHGAHWKFLVWGLLHGLYMVFGGLTAGWRHRCAATVGLDRLPRLQRVLGVFVTFNLVCLAWIFFRADSISDAASIVCNIFQMEGVGTVVECLTRPGRLNEVFGLSRTHLVAVAAGLAILELGHLLQMCDRLQLRALAAPTCLRWLAYIILILVIANFGIFQNPRQFIYFQF